MNLRDYIQSLDEPGRQQLAAHCHTTLPHLRNVMYGYRPCAPALAVAIECHSANQVTRPELRPQDWQAIWPELATKEAA